MTKLRDVLALNIKTHRNALGLSQSKLADKVDTATNYIAAIEAGRRFPSDAMLERIAEALGIDAPYLFGMETTNADSIRKVHEAVLTDVGQFVSECISNKLEELKQTKNETLSRPYDFLS
jgi:transcriptional regulator with XRE-family HTH domain